MGVSGLSKVQIGHLRGVKMSVMKRLSSMAIVLALACSTVLGGCSGLPKPDESPIASSPLPTPSSAGLAVVGGRIMRVVGNHSEPMVGTKILLASVLRSEDGAPIMAGASEETSPMAITLENGVFIFADIPPGTYGIAVVTPIGSFLIRDKMGNDFLFTVQPGAVLDLGEIHTTLPY